MLHCFICNSYRFKNIEDNLIAGMATYLDPRLKSKGFATESSLKIFREQVEMEMLQFEPKQHEEVVAHVAAPEIDSSRRNLLWGAFEACIASIRAAATPLSAATVELKTYNDDILLELQSDPLAYWASREAAYPRLSKMAKKYLCVPATSVPSERIFSKAGLVVADRRNRLSTDHTKQLLFINANIN